MNDLIVSQGTLLCIFGGCIVLIGLALLSALRFWLDGRK
jgi:hypothetical protein